MEGPSSGAAPSGGEELPPAPLVSEWSMFVDEEREEESPADSSGGALQSGERSADSGGPGFPQKAAPAARPTEKAGKYAKKVSYTAELGDKSSSSSEDRRGGFIGNLDRMATFPGQNAPLDRGQSDISDPGASRSTLGGKWAIQKRAAESTQNFRRPGFSPCPISCCLLVCE